MSDAAITKTTFEHHLLRAMYAGDNPPTTGRGLSEATWEAIGVVAREYPNVTDESVQAAREAFSSQSN
jgi:hypothetical protein